MPLHKKYHIGLRLLLKWLIYLHQLFNNDNLKTFKELKNDLYLPSTDFFRYLQERTFLTTHNEWGKLIKPTSIENFLKEIQIRNGDKNKISEVYKIWIYITPYRWGGGRDEHGHITEHLVCTEAHLVTNTNTWREFKWKTVFWFFRTQKIVSTMGPTHPSSCWRNCGTCTADHIRIFWQCPNLSYWRKVFVALKEVF